MGKTVREGFGRRLYDAMMEAGRVKRKGHMFGPDLDALARRLGVTNEAARKYLKGMSLPDPERMHPLAEWCDVNIAWLRDGVGPKHGANGVSPEDTLQTDSERQLIRLFRQGKPDEQDQIVRLARVLLKKDG